VLPEGTVENPTTFIDFEGIDETGRKRIDGMRTDIAGNLFITRKSLTYISVFSPDGQLALNISLPTAMTQPSNL
jgi:sugar lactone lactonase YvrE